MITPEFYFFNIINQILKKSNINEMNKFEYIRYFLNIFGKFVFMLLKMYMIC